MVIRKNYISDLCYHVAKQLYFALDLKALEDVVFVPVVKGDVKVYTSSKGTRIAEYSIVKSYCQMLCIGKIRRHIFSQLSCHY